MKHSNINIDTERSDSHAFKRGFFTGVSGRNHFLQFLIRIKIKSSFLFLSNVIVSRLDYRVVT